MQGEIFMKKKKKAKDQSRRAIIAASIWVFIHSVIKALFPMLGFGEYGLSMKEIVESGAFIIIGWAPVYGSIWLDKVFGRKEDEKQNEELEVKGFTC